MLDRYWTGSVARISPEAPVPVLSVNKIEERAGGAANVAQNIAAFGAQCMLLSISGDDEASRAIKKIVGIRNVATHFVTDASMSTVIKLRMMARNQQLLRADFDHTPDAAALVAFAQKFADLIDDVDVVVISDYGKGSLKNVQKLLEIAKRKNVVTFVDPKGSDFSRYKNASVITPNRSEFESVAGVCTDEKTLQKHAQTMIQNLGLEALLVTLGDEGMRWFEASGNHHAKAAHRQEVFDVSGAGDTVIAAVATARAVGLPIEQSMHFANLAAGIVVSKPGVAVAELSELSDALGAQNL